MIMAAPKPAKPRTMPAMQATTAQIRKGSANRSGMRAATLALPDRDPGII
jgi:hypothetical protein